MIRFLRSLFGWAALLAAPQYPTADPTPPGFNPRAACYPPPAECGSLQPGHADMIDNDPLPIVWREGER